MLHPVSPDTRLTGTQVRARFGGISNMTLWRWLRTADFPAPIIVNKRRYWRLGDIETWERAQVVFKVAA